jgi:hypothetical protein
MNVFCKRFALVLPLALLSSTVLAEDALTNLKDIDQQNEGTIDLEDRDGKEHTALEAAKTVKKERVKILRVRDLHKLTATFAAAERLDNLECLTLNFCWTGPRVITSEELSSLAHINGLEQLNLMDVNLPAEGLLRLKVLPNLREVTFGRLTNGGTFTDAHLAALAEIGTLRSVTVSRYLVSEPAEAAFRKARPDCKLTVHRPRIVNRNS